MPTQYTYGTAGATGGGFASLRGFHVPFNGSCIAVPGVPPVKKWINTRPLDTQDLFQRATAWQLSVSSHMDGGGNSGQGLQIVGQMRRSWNVHGYGSQSKNFLRGLCVDASDVPVSNAIVQAFVTTTDVFAGEVQAHTDGTYGVGVEQSKVTPHYLVAYKPGSPDIAGTTVNTLLPTNVDGT